MEKLEEQDIATILYNKRKVYSEDKEFMHG